MADRLLDLLRCDVPIQLAPMGSVSSTPALALAVADAGGHAVYPALTTGADVLVPIADALARRTRAFGINFLVPFADPGIVEEVAARVPYVDFFLGEPDAGLVARAQADGAVCGWQVETGEEARAAEAAGCDLVIAKAWESGGRKRVEGPTLLALLDAVLDAVTIPVLAAGGIATARGVAAALAAGADGVRVGTRFIAAAESDAHPQWVEAVLAARAEDAVVSQAYNTGLPVPGPHRVLRAALAAAEHLDDGPVGEIAGVPVERFAPTPPTRDATGAVAAMALYAGQSAGAVRRVRPAAEIVAELSRAAVRAS